MAILPTTSRDKTFAAVGFVALALAAAYYFYVWQPKQVELTDSQTRVDSLLVMNQRAKAELAQGRTQALKVEADRLAADLAVMRLLVPTVNEVPTLLDQVSTAARRVGLDIADVQPLASLVGDQYEAYKYRLAVRGGSYHQIGTLLANIGTLQRIVAPINLVLSPQSADPKAVKKERSQNIEARFEIQTYVARAPLPAPVVKRAPAETPKPGEK